ncbi:MAG: hypothetical protein P4M07_22370 [Xanthobacteraceae bacterium]|nr:hypothetical protein [Xanthobacteraceae bacterium]
MIFNIRNWCWRVGEDSANVYSSASFSLVPTVDSTYQARLASGGVPTAIDSMADLIGVLRGVPVTRPRRRRSMRRARGAVQCTITTINPAPLRSKFVAAIS